LGVVQAMNRRRETGTEKIEKVGRKRDFGS